MRTAIKRFLVSALRKLRLFDAVRSLVSEGHRNSQTHHDLVAATGAIVEGLQIVARRPSGSGRPRVSVGQDSVLRGTLVLESETGRISIGARSFVGGALLISVNDISIGNDVMISWGCTIVDNNAHSTVWADRANDVTDALKGLRAGTEGAYKDWGLVKSAPIRIGDKAWVGFNAIILKGVTIGEGAIVAAGSVVTHDVPPFTVVGGNPARMLKETM